jgi:hypothetical protein
MKGNRLTADPFLARPGGKEPEVSNVVGTGSGSILKLSAKTIDPIA